MSGTLTNIKPVRLDGEAMLRDRPEVAAFSLIGSAMYLPAEQCGDVDFAVLLKEGHDAHQFLTNLILAEGWDACGEQYEASGNHWGAVRRESLNLMVTHDRQWYADYLLAMEVCKVLRLTVKDDRIAVCRVVRDKLPADVVRPEPAPLPF